MSTKLTLRPQTLGVRASLLFVCAAGCLTSGAAGAEWSFSPSVAVESQHSSNFQLFTDDALKDSLIANSAVATLDVSQQTELVQASGRLELSYSTYSGDRTLADIDRQYLDFQIQRELERGSLGASVTIQRDDLLRLSRSLADPDSALTDANDELEQTLTDPNVDLNFTTQQVERTTSSYKVLAQYSLSERNSARFNYTFVDRDIDSPNQVSSESTQVRSNQRHSIDLTFSRALTERSKLKWSNRATRSNSQTIGKVNIYETAIGWSSSLTRETKLSTLVGISRTSGAANDKTGLLTRASVSHLTSWGILKAGASRNFRPTLAGTINETDILQFSLTRQLAPAWDLEFRASGSQQTRSVDENIGDIGLKTVRVGPKVSWLFSPKWQLSGGYEYRWIERTQLESIGRGSDHAGTISINYTPAGFRL